MTPVSPANSPVLHKVGVGWEADNARRVASAARYRPPHAGTQRKSDSHSGRDGDSLARRAIREALGLAGFTVVAQAADIPQTVALAARYAPDVAVVDSDIRPNGGLAAVTAVSEVAPQTRVILLASNGHVDGALLAVTQGAAGYLARDIELDALGRAVDGVMKGEAAISRAMALRLVERVRALAGGADGMRPVRSGLTTREWEVVDLLKTARPQHRSRKRS